MSLFTCRERFLLSSLRLSFLSPLCEVLEEWSDAAKQQPPTSQACAAEDAGKVFTSPPHSRSFTLRAVTLWAKRVRLFLSSFIMQKENWSWRKPKYTHTHTHTHRQTDHTQTHIISPTIVWINLKKIGWCEKVFFSHFFFLREKKSVNTGVRYLFTVLFVLMTDCPLLEEAHASLFEMHANTHTVCVAVVCTYK